MTRRLPLAAALLSLAVLAAAALTPALGSGAGARPAAVQQLTRGIPLPPPPDPLPSHPAVAVDPGHDTPGVPQQVTLRVGDSVIVDGAGLGCQINRRAGRVYVECGRTGDPAGTYMTLVGKRKVMVARLRSASSAKVILTARQRGGWRACGMAARAARAATAATAGRAGGRGCR